MDSDGWYRGRTSGRAWAWVILWGLGALLLTAVAVNMLLAGTGVIYDSTEPRGAGSIVGSFLWLAGAVICYLFAIHFEHTARGLPHGKITSATQDAVRARFPAGRGPRVFHPGGPFRRHGPRSAIAGGIILTVIGAGAVAGAFGSHSEAAKSGYTQTHGVADQATVTSVDNEKSCGRHSCHYYAYVTVTLRTAVSGHGSTTVNVPDKVFYTDGQTISVLVDPRDPGYAELPGSPYETDADTVGVALFAALALALGVTGLIRGRRMLVRERAWRTV